MKRIKYKIANLLYYTLSTVILCAPFALVTYWQYIDYITYGII